MPSTVVVKKTLEEVKILLGLLRDSIEHHQSMNKDNMPNGYKEAVFISFILSAQKHTDDTIKDISFLLGSLSRKIANIYVLEKCGIELIKGSNSSKRKLYHTYGIKLDISKFMDNDLILN